MALIWTPKCNSRLLALQTAHDDVEGDIKQKNQTSTFIRLYVVLNAEQFKFIDMQRHPAQCKDRTDVRPECGVNNNINSELNFQPLYIIS